MPAKEEKSGARSFVSLTSDCLCTCKGRKKIAPVIQAFHDQTASRHHDSAFFPSKSSLNVCISTMRTAFEGRRVSGMVRHVRI
jgi:hypothetical protein